MSFVSLDVSMRIDSLSIAITFTQLHIHCDSEENELRCVLFTEPVISGHFGPKHPTSANERFYTHFIPGTTNASQGPSSVSAMHIESKTVVVYWVYELISLSQC